MYHMLMVALDHNKMVLKVGFKLDWLIQIKILFPLTQLSLLLGLVLYQVWLILAKRL